MADEKKDLTLGERAVNWAKVIGLVFAATASAIGYFKSDDAQDDVSSLIVQLGERVAKQEKIINIQSEKLEKMARRMIFFQGHQAGFSAGKLHAKVERTEKRLDECRAKKVPRSVKSDELMRLLGVARSSKKPPAAKSAGAVQSIPRLMSKPFRKGK